MTPAQAKALRQLVAADRRYWLKVERRESITSALDLPSLMDRGVEIGAYGIDSRTASKLEELGLAETVSIDQFRSYIFLGSYDPSKELE
jgi:hypothetical protein